MLMGELYATATSHQNRFQIRREVVALGKGFQDNLDADSCWIAEGNDQGMTSVRTQLDHRNVADFAPGSGAYRLGHWIAESVASGALGQSAGRRWLVGLPNSQSIDFKRWLIGDPD